ncbi:MAG: hypothetical protein ACO3DQ_06640 [Cephaloticoccus sp.]
MRLLSFGLALAALTTAVRADGPVEFTRVWPAWRDTASFVRISEYFGGEENTGRQTMLRTRAEERDGFYFLARVNNRGAAEANARFVLDIITPDSPQPKTYTFTTTLAAGSHTYNLGLTGKDWAGKDAQPVAWHLRLLAADERELAASQSFLWRMPDDAGN